MGSVFPASGFESACARRRRGLDGMAQVLNLNTEVVKLRKDVKRVRVLIIRKLTRHITKLKSKKGTEDAVLKNQRRAQRLLEEIHAIKKVKPDIVTKSALQDEINFEKVCKKPGSGIDDRAIARLAAHPLLKRKITDLKVAVKTFKDARQKKSTVPSSRESNSTKVSEQPEPAQNCSIDELAERKQNITKRAKVDVQLDTEVDNKKTNIDNQDQKLLEKETASSQDTVSAQATESQVPPRAETGKGPTTQNEKQLAIPSRLEMQKEAESDEEKSDGEEKEYFDDSTEERFFKQSSGPDDSDSDDDFFLGKVRRTKKKKTDSDVPPAKGKADRILKSSMDKVKDFGPQRIPGAGPEKSKASGKATKLESVFCSSLSESKQKPTSMKKNVKDKPQQNKKTATLPQCKPQIMKQRPGKGAAVKQESRREQLQQALHPSWEASKRRKEQLSQIAVFQGKKIMFADD
ncbi:serum response factor-binding protein 1 [Rhinatrema bivittatum]|uniref:serum response factor-binding protein 1 n=1 Tax=Rhinatrema bivittatum TaxID=194408 RepID=UPI00112999F5|nr:serum response factor-binding protein 1 [Rhinatrema bivittatum]